jgi:hypothetical protein
MEEVLEVYKRPHDPARPLVCLDETSKQLVAETRTPIPAGPGHAERVDYEYERNGTANVFMFVEPLGGWRKANERARKTSMDWAEEVQELLEVDYPEVQRVRLICDNLNTHKIASLYEAFHPEQARRLAKRIELHYTPKHGSWLNIAECELSVLTRQCLGHRIPDRDTLRAETKAWQRDRNAAQKGVDWQFTTNDARIKLNRLYPQIQT